MVGEDRWSVDDWERWRSTEATALLLCEPRHGPCVSLRADAHCCARNEDEEASFDVTNHNGGGGWYIAINATEWAIDSDYGLEEIIAILRRTWKDAKESTND